MAGSTIEYDEKESRATERAYMGPEITAQRKAILRALSLRPGERALDVGVGPGLLCQDMARQVGEGGRVHGIDNSDAMVRIARARCHDLSQVAIELGDATNLPVADRCFEAVVCTQVLLYVDDVERALAEMHRALRPGGRVLVLETDWRGLVLNSALPEITELGVQAWDAAVASPGLPPRMEPMLRGAGFDAVAVTPVPVLSTSFEVDGFPHLNMQSFRESMVNQGLVTEHQAVEWLDDLRAKHHSGEFFLCVNRFMFTACRL